MERPAKRQRTDNEAHSPSLRVTGPNDLHQWLEFIQSADPSVKEGINNFKSYLSSIAHLDDIAEQSKQLRFLKEYCEWQKAPSDDQLHFYDLLQTWSFAVDNNAEAIISAVPAALAQFLRTISGFLEFRTFGLALVDTLLRRDQSKLFERCLVSPRSKPHLASPCLRLLTEMLSFDAGARANEFWARRDLVVHKFDALLEQHSSTQDLEERRKPSVRRMALRLFLALLKYLDATAKTSFLSQVRAFHACLRGLSNDGDDIILDILQSLNQTVILDKDIPRPAILRLFNSSHLDSLALLYRFDLVEDQADAKEVVREAAHNTLLLLCTTENGVVVPGSGWYPSSSNGLGFQLREDDTIDLGLNTLYPDDGIVSKHTLSNAMLALFLQRLRPREDVLQSQLLLSTLSAVPELVADYFAKCKPLPAPASDDVQWRSTFALLFSVIDSPIPEAFGWQDGAPRYPPPPATVARSIFPQPLDRMYLNKLLSSTDDVLKVSGARALTVVLRKLDTVLSAFSQCSQTHSYVWDQASCKITALIGSQLPAIREVLLAFQHTSHDSTAAYTALLESIVTYYQVLPNVASSSNFDVGPIMSDLCATFQEENLDPEQVAAIVEQLSYAVQAAELSSSTRWLHKANNDVLSPFGQVLKTVAGKSALDETKAVISVLREVLVHRGVVCADPQSFASLLSSVETTKKFTPSPELFLFLDNCFVRANQKPVRYVGEIENASRMLSDKKLLSLYIGAIPEQWSYACKKHEDSKSTIKNIAAWIARIFSLLDTAGENYRVMIHFQENMLGDTKGKQREYLQDAFDKIRKKPVPLDTGIQFDEALNAQDGDDKSVPANPEFSTTNLLKLATTQVSVPETLSNLDKWPSTLDIELEIQTNRLPKLILCTSSPNDEIRLQTFQLLQSIAYTIDTSSAYEGKSQIFLLLGELIETIRQFGLSQAPPTLIPELTNTLLHILVDPTHKLYSKVNEFLLHAPVWTSKRTINYWLEKILMMEPDDDEPQAFQVEVTWLLTWLLNSLRGELDVDLYRRSGLWEQLLSLYVSPTLTKEIRTLILAIVWRGGDIPGGADILWTRFGMHSWLEGMLAVDAGNEKDLLLVREKLMQSCDREMVKSWKVTCSLNKPKKMDLD